MASGAKAIFPDMKLYEEILFLQGYFKGKYVVENVKSWYKPLIQPILLQRHYFWTNFEIPIKEFKKDQIRITGGRNLKEGEAIKIMENNLDIDLSNHKVSNKRLMLRNCVSPEVALHIINQIN